jgi:predicted AAA+ superfamily ATPase
MILESEIDKGFVQANSLSFSEDKGILFENLVFLQLRRKHQKLYYFRQKYECDFVVKTGAEVTPVYQACYKLTSDNLHRELIGIKEAMDYFGITEATKVTLRQNDYFETDDKKINVVEGCKWFCINHGCVFTVNYKLVRIA